MVAGLAWWSGLDDATRQCALDATAEAGEEQRQAVLEASNSLIATMEDEGVTFAEADKAAYQEATQSVYDKYAADYPELVDALRSAARGQ